MPLCKIDYSNPIDRELARIMKSLGMELVEPTDAKMIITLNGRSYAAIY